MEKILIIGGAGFVGMPLTKNLVESGYKVTVFDEDAEKLNELGFSKDIEFIKGTIEDKEKINKAVLEKDCIINLAALITNKRVDGAGEKSLKINCLGELNVLESIRISNPSCLHIFLSSKSVFGKEESNGEIISETKPQKPFSFYGIHKQTCENYLDYYQGVHGLNTCLLRVFGVYGLDLNKNPKGIAAFFVVNCLNNKKVILNEGGSQINDFIYIDDLICLLSSIIEKNIKGVYNVGSGEGTTIKEIWNITKKVCNNEDADHLVINHKFSDEEKLFELGYYVADISKIKKVSGWYPKISIEEGIKKIRETYLKK